MKASLKMSQTPIYIESAVDYMITNACTMLLLFSGENPEHANEANHFFLIKYVFF